MKRPKSDTKSGSSVDDAAAREARGQTIVTRRHSGPLMKAVYEQIAGHRRHRHAHSIPMIVLPQGGTEATILKDGIPKPFVVDADHFMIVPAHCGHETRTRGVVYESLALFPMEEALIRAAPLHAPKLCPMSSWTRAVVTKCLQTIAVGQVLSHELESVLFAAILEDTGAATPVDPRQELPNHRLARALHIIDVELATGLSVTTLADRVGLHPAALLRLFRARLGMPPVAYMQQRRLEHAQQLLRSTDMPVTEVAHAVGYGDLSAFSEAFRQKYGTSPRRWREQGFRNQSFTF